MITESEEKETLAVIESLQCVIKRDEAHFENKITLISTGAIALLMAFVAKLDGCVYCRCLFTWGVVLIGVALSMNMFMYIFDKWKFRTLMYDLIDGYNVGEYRNAVRRNNGIIKTIDILNAIDLMLLIAGLVVSFLFVYQNTMQ